MCLNSNSNSNTNTVGVIALNFAIKKPKAIVSCDSQKIESYVSVNLH